MIMDVNKPVCKYGASCYRKNADHFKQYSHPGRREEEEEVGDRSRGEEGGKRSRPSKVAKASGSFCCSFLSVSAMNLLSRIKIRRLFYISVRVFNNSRNEVWDSLYHHHSTLTTNYVCTSSAQLASLPTCHHFSLWVWLVQLSLQLVHTYACTYGVPTKLFLVCM